MPKPGRQYLPLDVNYEDDPRVMALSDAAQLLDIRAMLLMKRLRSHGAITRRQLERKCPIGSIGGDVGVIAPDADYVIQELLDVGLYLEEGDQMIRSSWGEWNGSATDLEVAVESGTFGNHQRWHVKRGLVKPDCPHCVPQEVRGESGGESGTRSGPNPIEKRREENTNSRDSNDSPRIDASLSARRERREAFEADFTVIWTHYPRKDSKQAAKDAYVARRRAGVSAEELLRAVGNFKRAMALEGRERNHIMHGSRFFGPKKEWLEYLAPKPPPTSTNGAAHPEPTW